MSRREIIRVEFHAVLCNLGRIGSQFAMAVIVVLGVTGRPASAFARETPSEYHPIEQIRNQPCDFLAALLGNVTSTVERHGRLRRGKGDMVVNIVATDGSRDLNLLAPGQRCQGGFVGVDRRPGKKKRVLSHLEVWLWGDDETTVRFMAYLTEYELLPDGRIGSVVNYGCTERIQGEVGFVNKAWSAVDNAGFVSLFHCAAEEEKLGYKLVPRPLPLRDLKCDQDEDCEIVSKSDVDSCRAAPDVEPYAMSKAAASRHRSQRICPPYHAMYGLKSGCRTQPQDWVAICADHLCKRRQARALFTPMVICSP